MWWQNKYYTWFIIPWGVFGIVILFVFPDRETTQLWKDYKWWAVGITAITSVAPLFVWASHRLRNKSRGWRWFRRFSHEHPDPNGWYLYEGAQPGLDLVFAEKLNEYKAAIIWMSGSPSFSPEGEGWDGWVKIRDSLLQWPAGPVGSGQKEVKP